ncbi:rhomboid family intramembrane serine protease [Streptomyces sp. AJS327]|uniref:rhomboid family intramembrane serine protease n=1 Tax=Streptomyces sp. AJS327 TaxID=2545265 RepID=UPI0015E05E73|nr:rhomboid family intramembrane serine protease [Streptomyces sp. AJS327]MBA0052944.1 rhomboid family intramembrane serine protease [Streptomyces sp. AJS327]
MEQEQPGRPEQSLATCYRHPDRETGISCTRCERSICPECMITASVGFHCPSCVSGGSGTGHAPSANQPRTVAGSVLVGDTRLVTKILLGVNLAVFVAVLVYGDRLVNELMLFGRAATEAWGPLEGVAEGEVYRLVSSMFLHQEFLHIAMNMLGLWFLGPPLEAALGRARFITLYLLSGLAGGALTFLIASPVQPSLGASGAIFGLFGATAVVMRRLRHDMRPIAVLLAINLIFTFTWENIAWEAHIGGLVAGALLTFAIVHAPRERRALVQWGAAAGLLLVIAAVCVVRTVQLVG